MAEMTEIERLNAAVDAFAGKMKAKLHKKYAAGFKGWEDASPAAAELLFDKFMDHVQSQCAGVDEWVDLANFCMFLERINSIAESEDEIPA